MYYGRVTRHHLIAQMHWGTWHPDNILHIQEIPHKCHHILFNNQLPIDCLRTMAEYARPTLDIWAYRLIDWVLQKVEWLMEVYNPECYDKERFSKLFVWS